MTTAAVASPHAQLGAVLAALAARPPASYRWFGRRVDVLDAGDRSRLGAARTRARLVEAIAGRLLDDFAGSGMPSASHSGAPAAPAGDELLARALSQANCGRGPLLRGWRVVSRGSAETVVERPDGLRLHALADDGRVVVGTPPATTADVRVPKELGGLSPGIYVALGDATRGDEDPIRVRLSFAVAAASAVTLVARTTYALNRAALPFALELRTDPAQYARRPGAELVVARTDFAALRSLLRPLLRALGPQLGPIFPALAKPLARGLAVAEEPARGPRFAERCCRLVADAVVTAAERDARTPAARLAVVEERFAAAGLRIDAPHLQPGSDDDAYARP